MKHLGVVILVAIIITVAVGINYGLIQWAESRPPYVRFSIEVPQAYNATAFKVTDDITYNRQGYDYSTFPFSINDTAQVGTTYTIHVTYYVEEPQITITGLNIEPTPTYSQVGQQSYTFQVKELSDNVVESVGQNFSTSIVFIGSNGLLLLLCAGIFNLFISFKGRDNSDE